MSFLSKTKQAMRIRRHSRVRARIWGTKERPRLAVYRSNRFISAQLIDDDAARTLASAHGREFGGTKKEQAEAVGKAIAERAKKMGVQTVVFDRGGYAYAAQIKVLADTARATGLTF